MTSPSDALLALLPSETIHRHRIVPLAVDGETLQVGVAAPPAASLLRELAFLTGKTITPVALETPALEALLEACGPGTPLETKAGHRATSHPMPPAAPGERVAPQGSVVQQVDTLIQQAIEQHASDVHVEPYETVFRVRYRRDGVLHTVGHLSLLQREALTARLKIMADLDIAEKRRPQDGRIRYPHDGRTIDLRVAVLPTDFGEKVVLRLLDKRHLRLDLDGLGFEASGLQTFRRAIQQPYGIILVSGPTGSGKTTTLYAALNALNTEAVNITTIEDPIEYNLPGINQTRMRSDIGFTFAQALRAFLRQDPNVIMVGEIRDGETAAIAIRAALTGHLVLSTIHTNDAPSTITRLVDMGIEPFLVVSSLRLAIAQRLVRRICPSCKEPLDLEAALFDDLPDEVRKAFQNGPAMVYRGRGCDHCNGTGYRGRTALFEVMPLSEHTAALIMQRASAYDLRRQLQREGMHTLRDAGLARVRAGVTTLEEILRETSL